MLDLPITIARWMLAAVCPVSPICLRYIIRRRVNSAAVELPESGSQVRNERKEAKGKRRWETSELS
jgi:hypothetical protein